MNKTYKHYKLLKILGFLGVVAIAVASLIPQTPQSSSVPFLDKLLHFSVYSIASFYLNQLYYNRLFKQIVLFLLIYSGIIEILQGLTGYRSPEWADMLANLSGIIFGSLLSKRSNLLYIFDRLLK